MMNTTIRNDSDDNHPNNSMRRAVSESCCVYRHCLVVVAKYGFGCSVLHSLFYGG